MFSSRRQREELASLRAEVASLQSRLAADINGLDPGEDPQCRLALSDASERMTAAGGLLSSATTPGELRVAQRILVEGLTAARVVRQRQGLPLGSELPALGTTTVSEPTQVSVAGDSYTAHPEYHPERPHFFSGGTIGGVAAPAGYYRTPFWKKALAVGGAVVGAEMLGDAVGDIFGGGGDYDGGGWGGGGFGDDDGGGWGGGGGDF